MDCCTERILCDIVAELTVLLVCPVFGEFFDELPAFPVVHEPFHGCSDCRDEGSGNIIHGTEFYVALQTDIGVDEGDLYEEILECGGVSPVSPLHEFSECHSLHGDIRLFPLDVDDRKIESILHKFLNSEVLLEEFAWGVIPLWDCALCDRRAHGHGMSESPAVNR